MTNPVVAAMTQGIATVAGAATNAAVITHASTCGACVTQGALGAVGAGATKIALTAVMLAHPVTATVVVGGALLAGVAYIADKLENA